ncbi:hypothetical protein ACL598_17055 [Bordetella bronchialis]|uniref:hypothetical protein n=1 Tax=Bordetella bronchialis TaxID=463025 RepID=UPI003D0056EA
MTNQPNEIWLSWEDSAGYGYWDTRDEAELNSAEDFHPVRFVPAASEAGAVPDVKDSKHRILNAAAEWADLRDVGPNPAKEAWRALCIRVEAELSTMAEAAPAAQPEKQHVPDMAAELGLNQHAQPEKQAAQVKLYDSQWVNIVNHANCWADYSKEDAVHEAVKMTEEAIKKNASAAPPAPSQQADNGLPWHIPVQHWSDTEKAALTTPSQQAGADVGSNGRLLLRRALDWMMTSKDRPNVLASLIHGYLHGEPAYFAAPAAQGDVVMPKTPDAETITAMMAWPEIDLGDVPYDYASKPARMMQAVYEALRRHLSARTQRAEGDGHE